MGAAPAPAPAPATAPATAPAPAAAPAMADWVTVDQSARTVTINLVAGQTDANNRWNFNGHANGAATVVVPQGFRVTVNLRNQDPANFHSVAVMRPANPWPATFSSPTPAFEGATSPNATSMTESTSPNGGTATFSFTAGTAGSYALVCLVPAHAVTGMWIGLEVSATGESGVRM